MGAPYGEPDAEKIILEDVVGHIGVKGLQHRQSSVTIVVDVVICRKQRSSVGTKWLTPFEAAVSLATGILEGRRALILRP